MDSIEKIISPFAFIIEQLFLFSFKLTGSYGWSIILLSFGVSLLLLPIFIVIEKAKKKDDVIKRNMQAHIDEIKRVYKGQERYYYLKTLNRQHNYSPLKALVPVLSLLIQIPFFIAAYVFIENHEALSGISFGFITDLSQPDALFGAVNFLPLAMTFVNLISGWFYTRYSNTDERKQMLLVAGIFLILLFKMPSGLVLYWTMNNVFSFFRLFITNKEVFRKNKERQLENKIVKQQVVTRLGSSYKKLIYSSIAIFTIYFGIQLFALSSFSAPLLLSQLYISFGIAIATITVASLLVAFSPQIITSNKLGTISFFKSTWKAYNTLFVIISAIIISLQICWALSHTFDTIIQRVLMSVAIGYITILVLSVISIFYQGQFIFLAKNAKYSLNEIIGFAKTKQHHYYPFIIYIFLFLALYFWLAGMFYYGSLNKVLIAIGAIFLIAGIMYHLFYGKKERISLNIKTNNAKQFNSIFIISTIFITSIIFFWNPLMVYASFPETFPLPAIKIFPENALLFLGSSVIILVSYSLLPKKVKIIGAIVFATLSIVFFFNALIAPINVGTLQLGQYIKAYKMAKPLHIYIIEGLAIVALFIALFKLLHSKHLKHIKLALLVILLVVSVQSLFTATNSGDFLTKANKNIQRPSSISFSKTKENIVFFIPDMFMGYHMHQILKDNNNLFDDYEGFTWYPNTLSVSTNTSPSISSLLAGPEFNVNKLNNDKDRTMGEKITEASEHLVANAKSNNYRFTGTKMVYSKIDKNKFDAYLPSWHNNWNTYNDQLNIGPVMELDFEILWKNGLFYCSPLCIKPQIYNNGDWVQIDDDINWNTNLTRDCNFIRLLPYISDTLSTDKNLIYIHSKATHRPWNIVTNQGDLIKDTSAYATQEWFISEFKNWLKWMKDNGVYDNTKIVLVSDHSFYMPDDEAKAYGNEFNWDTIAQKKLPAKEFWRVNSLLMVKDFNKHHKLNTDWRLMTNSDATAIVFNTEDNPTIGKPQESRTVPVFIVGNLHWSTSKKELPIYYQFNVTDSIYDSNNWQKIN